jgi:hypothetical protein
LAPSVVRWVLTDPADLLETWTFEVNPSSAESFQVTWQADPFRPAMTGVALIRRKRQLTSTSFSGVLRTRSMYDALVEWVSKDKVLHLTDHWLRTWEVLLQGLEITQERASPSAPWRMPYVVRCVVFGEVV